MTGDLSMKTLRGTSLASEMGWDRQMMEDILPFGFVTLQRGRQVQLKLKRGLKYKCEIEQLEIQVKTFAIMPQRVKCSKKYYCIK